MLNYRVNGFSLWLIILWATATSAQDNLFVSGFVIDTDGVGIEDAVVIISSDFQRIATAKSGRYGWFETTNPLPQDLEGTEIVFDVFRGGYDPIINEDRPLTKSKNHFRLEMTAMKNVSREGADQNYPTDITYGYVYDKNSKLPLAGALITVKKNPDDEVTLSSSASRQSGYFYLHLGRQYDLKTERFSLKVVHPEHDTEQKDNFALQHGSDLLSVGLDKRKYSYSLGVAAQLQYTGDVADKESGAALMLPTLSYYFDPVLVIDDFFPRFPKSQFIGLDASIGFIPYTVEKDGTDEVSEIFGLSVGVLYSADNFILPIRFGVTFNETGEEAIYLGIGIPIIYFGEEKAKDNN